MPRKKEEKVKEEEGEGRKERRRTGRMGEGMGGSSADTWVRTTSSQIFSELAHFLPFSPQRSFPLTLSLEWPPVTRTPLRYFRPNTHPQ